MPCIPLTLPTQRHYILPKDDAHCDTTPRDEVSCDANNCFRNLSRGFWREQTQRHLKLRECVGQAWLGSGAHVFVAIRKQHTTDKTQSTERIKKPKRKRRMIMTARERVSDDVARVEEQ